jgi:hypothetical protein
MSFIETILQNYFINLIVTTPIVNIFMLGIVFLLGRMLDIIKSDHEKNIIAVLTAVIVSYFMMYIDIFHAFQLMTIKKSFNDLLFLRSWLTLFFTSIVCYVLVTWKLYDRMDCFLDRKFGADKETEIPKTRRPKK